jgi:hypothetical protein
MAAGYFRSGGGRKRRALSAAVRCGRLYGLALVVVVSCAPLTRARQIVLQPLRQIGKIAEQFLACLRKTLDQKIQ